MKIGYSLPVGYLADLPDTRADQAMTNALGPASAGLSLLMERGVQSIELQGIRNAEASLCQRAVAAISAAGLNMTVHGYLPPEGEPQTFASAYPWLLALPPGQSNLTMTVHSLSSKNESWGTLVERTAVSLEAYLNDIAERELPIRIALEINRSHGLHHPGVSWEGILEIAAQVERPELGFCWDFGHSFWNHLHDGLPVLPPADVVKRTLHTHIHDLSPEDDTHWPLSSGKLPLQDFLPLLQAADYQGVFNLELYPLRWAKKMNVAEHIQQSIARLKEELGSH